MRRAFSSIRDAAVAAAVVLTTSPSAMAKDPTVSECLLSSNGSVALRAAHKLREARAALLVCSASACPSEVREECGRRMDAVTAAIPTIVFEVKDGAGRDRSDVKVTMDGSMVAERLDGNAVTLDPGTHSFVFEATGSPPVTQSILLREGDKSRHVPVALAAPLAPAPPLLDVALSMPPTPQIDASVRGRAGHGQRVAGLVVGSAGALGVAVGGLFGALTFSSWSSANKECPTRVACGSEATSDRSHAVTYGAVSDIGFIAGGALLAGGVALYLTAEKDASASVGVLVLPGGLRVEGSF